MFINKISFATLKCIRLISTGNGRIYSTTCQQMWNADWPPPYRGRSLSPPTPPPPSAVDFTLHPPRLQSLRVGPRPHAPAQGHGLRGHSINNRWVNRTLNLIYSKWWNLNNFMLTQMFHWLQLSNRNLSRAAGFSWEKWKWDESHRSSFSVPLSTTAGSGHSRAARSWGVQVLHMQSIERPPQPPKPNSSSTRPHTILPYLISFTAHVNFWNYLGFFYSPTPPPPMYTPSKWILSVLVPIISYLLAQHVACAEWMNEEMNVQLNKTNPNLLLMLSPKPHWT